MKRKQPCIRNIMTTEILLYESDINRECIDFCEKRNIDCLPAIDDDNKYYRFDKFSRSFVKETISELRKISGDEYIFSPDLKNRFLENSVQFVYESSVQVGIIHFSDYNKVDVRFYLFQILNEFEQNLRNLLIAHGYTNKDMLDFFEIKSKNPIFSKKLQKHKNNKDLYDFPEFQSFDLSELIQLLSHKKLLKMDEEIARLRNQVMHVKDQILMADQRTDDLIYKKETFEKFFERVTILIQQNKQLNNRLAFKSSR